MSQDLAAFFKNHSSTYHICQLYCRSDKVSISLRNGFPSCQRLGPFRMCSGKEHWFSSYDRQWSVRCVASGSSHGRLRMKTQSLSGWNRLSYYQSSWDECHRSSSLAVLRVSCLYCSIRSGFDENRNHSQLSCWSSWLGWNRSACRTQMIWRLECSIWWLGIVNSMQNGKLSSMVSWTRTVKPSELQNLINYKCLLTTSK